MFIKIRSKMFQLVVSTNFKALTEVETFLFQLEKNENIKLHTSGSTGVPKQITLASELLKRSARKTINFLKLHENTKSLLCLDFNTIAGKMMLARAVEGGFSVQLINPSKRPLEFIETTIDFVAMVPLQLLESLENDLEKLRNVKTILIGGGPITANLENRLRTNNITVYHSFGMTETVSHIALRKAGKETSAFFEALPGVHFSSRNRQLVIHSEDLSISDLLTNDFVTLLSPRTFIWLGRKDFVINSGGYKLHPEILENRWSLFLTCSFFINKELDEKWGEKMVLYIENIVLPTIDKVLLSRTFKSYELPKTIYLCTEFVYTASGKIDRLKTVENNFNNCCETTF